MTIQSRTRKTGYALFAGRTRKSIDLENVLSAIKSLFRLRTIACADRARWLILMSMLRWFKKEISDGQTI